MLDERAHDLDVGRTALDDLARLVAHMPGEGQALNVAKQRVAHALDEVFGALGERHAAYVVGKAAQRCDDAE